MKRPDFININDWRLLEQKYHNLDYAVKKIQNNYPIQYLIGNVDFYGYKFFVNKDVLIPRFETETLLEKTIDYIKKLGLDSSSVLELGTGSGCISIALKKELPNLEITAMDISLKALKIARKNARLNKCKINFIKNNILKCKLDNNYDILISNPPYLKTNDVIDEKTKYEPQIALFGGEDGMLFYPKIFEIAKKVLNKKFLIALEIDEENGDKIKKLAKEHFPRRKIVLDKDLTGKDRYLFVISE